MACELVRRSRSFISRKTQLKASLHLTAASEAQFDTAPSQMASKYIEFSAARRQPKRVEWASLCSLSNLVVGLKATKD